MSFPSKKPNLPIAILSTLSLLFLITPTLAHARCYTCAVRYGMCFCVGGNIATGCTASANGCDFSGSWECGEGGCFLSKTNILTRRGVVPIDRVRTGDEVLSRDKNGAEKWVSVQRTYRALRVGYYLINGDLGVTGDHPFLCNGNWVLAENLKIGDRLQDRQGQAVEVASLDFVDAGVRVFNLDVISPDTFMAGGFLVHNKNGKAVNR